MVLEGKEVDVKIGSVGEASIDLDSKGVVVVSVGVKIDLVAELDKLAKETDNQLDDKIVGLVKAALGRA